MFVHKTFGEYFFIKYVIELLEETPRLSNEQIMLKLGYISTNYMYKRLENLLELALVENAKLRETEFIKRMEDCCQYDLSHFELLPISNSNIRRTLSEINKII